MMPAPWRGRLRFTFLTLALAVTPSALGRQQPSTTQDPLTLHARVREAGVPSGKTGAGAFAIAEKILRWDPAQTAIVICDMWNQHWCHGATRRVGELAPAMNQTIVAARAKGILIIHAPSSCMDAYKNHPARKKAQEAPKAANLPAHIGEWCNKIPAEEKGIYPIDQSDGGCDDGPQCPQGSPWKSQVAAIEILPEDAISDSGAEIWNLLESRGITNVMLMGVHTNMCVLGRPFGLRNLARSGKNVVLVRDLTDTMYNSRSWPYVSHFDGTERIVEHIEKYVAPTILSSELRGRPPFHFRPDDRPRAVFLIGDDEYKTEKTLPAFAVKELEPQGVRCTMAIADPKSPHDFPGAAALNDADLMVISVRRRAPKAEEMALIRRFVEAGKPLVGIRTACHAFDTRGKAPPGHAEWTSFDPDVLGGHYTGHHPNDRFPVIELLPNAKAHPILEGVSTPFPSSGSLYKTSPLKATAVPLLLGKAGSLPSEPVAWVNAKGSARIFYTSLGHPGDFDRPEFRRLLKNAIFWALDRKPAASTSHSPTASNQNHNTPPPENRPPFDQGQGPLSPRAALATFEVPGDLQLDLVLAEPDVRQPVSISFDERGRLWVVQYLQYPVPAGLKMLSHDSVWRAVYDKVPPPPPHHFRGKDKITIHEDTDGDGTFDRHKTFLDGLNIVTALARGRGGVWVLNPPYLLFYPDRDNDDVPDGDPEVHLQGFGLEDTHSVVNSLCWGPDGWLYAAQGSTVTGHVIRPSLDAAGKPRHSMGQLIWRYHPESRQYEVFAEGGGNAFGVEIDSKGRIYSGHNGGDTRGFHYVQGGYYQKGFNKHGPLSNSNAFGYFPAMKHDRVPRFTHTFVIYEAESLPDSYRGLLFGVAPLLHHVVMSRIFSDGSSFQTHDVGLAVSSRDPFFRPVDIKLGPDGALYIADWYDRQINHYRNHQGQLDAANGRIYRLRARRGGAHFKQPFDLSRLSTPDLVKLLADPSKWTRQTAQRLIADRKDKTIAPELRRLLAETTGQTALEALWALHAVGGLDEAAALKALEHPDPFVRLWTARLVCDQARLTPPLAQALALRASIETSVEVRSQLACSARRLPARDALPVVRSLLVHSDDQRDLHIPLLIWWAIEAKVASDPQLVLAMFSEKESWNRPIVKYTIIERLMRRFAASGTRADLACCAQLLALAPGPDDVKRLMSGFEAAFAGRSLAGLPPDLTSALASYSKESITLGLRRGKPEALAEALRILADPSADRAKQLELVQTISEVRPAGAVSATLRLACETSDNALRSASLLALAAYDDPAIAPAVLSAYPSMTDDVRAAAQSLLVTRRTSASFFLKGIESGAIARESVSRETAEKLSLLGDAAITKEANRLFGPVKAASSAELHSRIDRLASVIREGSGIPTPGKKIFERQCARCHLLFGQGGSVGPDLTTYRRDDLDTILLNIVNPSAEIREGFAGSIIAMTDGRILTGVVFDQDKNVVVIRDSNGHQTTLDRDAIDTMRPCPSSIMPEGLLEPLAAQELRDLFAYLRSTQPLID